MTSDKNSVSIPIKKSREAQKPFYEGVMIRRWATDGEPESAGMHMHGGSLAPEDSEEA